LKKLHRR